MGDYEAPARVLGVNFDASRANAGRRIHVAEGVVEDGFLQLIDCWSASERLDVDPVRERTIPGFVSYLADRDASCAIGLDFPFGLPAAVVSEANWEGFLHCFPGWYATPADLRRRCEMQASLVNVGGETTLCRATDEPVGALSPYDARLKTRTFHGIRDVLRPLVLTDAVSVVPMQAPDPGRPLLLEVYPAGTLDSLGLHDSGYTGDVEENRRRREENVAALDGERLELDGAVRERAVEDERGNALNGVAAAFAAYRNTLDPKNFRAATDRHGIEGHIYV